MELGESLTAHLLELSRNGRAAYLAAHPEPALILERPPEAEADDGGWASFNTNTFNVKAGGAIASMTDAELDAAARIEGLRLLALVKAAHNPWRGRISIGRARSNDLALPSAAVSKLHAHFTVDEDGSVRVTDAGSHNGTMLNGKRLVSGEPVLLTPGDRLELGNVKAVFHTPQSLCDFLAAQLTH